MLILSFAKFSLFLVDSDDEPDRSNSKVGAALGSEHQDHFIHVG